VIYLLDTNAWIAYLRQNNARLVQRFLQVVPTDILLNSVVLAELFYGAHHGAVSKRAANLALISRLQQNSHRCRSMTAPPRIMAKSARIWTPTGHPLGQTT
jgi:predicted nucleic acid-binding protein